jgi:hypothetical protein
VLEGVALGGAAREELLEREELSIEPTMADLREGTSAVGRMVAGGGGGLSVFGARAAAVVAGIVAGVGVRTALAVFVAGITETESVT